MASYCQKPGIRGSDVAWVSPLLSLVVILGNPWLKTLKVPPSVFKTGGLTAMWNYPRTIQKRGYSWVRQIFRKGAWADGSVAANFPHSALSETLTVTVLYCLGFSLNALRSVPPNKNCLNPTQHLCWTHHTIQIHAEFRSFSSATVYLDESLKKRQHGERF